MGQSLSFDACKAELYTFFFKVDTKFDPGGFPTILLKSHVPFLSYLWQVRVFVFRPPPLPLRMQCNTRPLVHSLFLILSCFFILSFSWFKRDSSFVSHFLAVGCWSVLDAHGDFILASHSSPDSPPKLVSVWDYLWALRSKSKHLWQCECSFHHIQMLATLPEGASESPVSWTVIGVFIRIWSGREKYAEARFILLHSIMLSTSSAPKIDWFFCVQLIRPSRRRPRTASAGKCWPCRQKVKLIN